MTTTLRRWQAEALPPTLEAIEAGRRAVVVATMGAGKSVFIRALILELMARHADPEHPFRVAVLTPTRKLVEQLAATLAEGSPPGTVGRFYSDAKEPFRQVVVTCNASARTLADAVAGLSPFDLLVCDEVHRSETEGLKLAIEALDPRRRLGLTATPFRSDERERIELFDEVVFRYSPGDALRDGVIVPWTVRPWTGPDTPLDRACLDLIRLHGDGPGLVNATSIEDAEAFAAYLTENGVRALAVHSKLSPTLQAARIEALRVGELATLVHVSMLQEGVDLPWLRWLCCRRLVGAKVRFVQEVGRVLRAFPGKTQAVILDPNDLFATFGLSYDAAVGWEPAEPVPALNREEPENAPERDLTPEERLARAVCEVAAWARQLALAYQAAGVVAQSRVTSQAWRSLPPTAKQVDALRRMLWASKRLPAAHGDVLEARRSQAPRPSATSTFRGARERKPSDTVEGLLAAAERLAHEAHDAPAGVVFQRADKLATDVASRTANQLRSERRLGRLL